MNRKLIGIAVVAGSTLALLTSQNLKSTLLPSGLITQTKPLSSDLIVTPEPLRTKPQIAINTSQGRFIIELRPDLAPKTVVNFLTKWNSGYCDNKTFHRVEDWVVQGCDPLGTGLGGETILPTESSSEKFVTGSVGVARKTTPADLSNDSQFFIVKKDSLFLDGQYTYFGKVISGMEVVNRLTIDDKILSSDILSK